MRETKVGKKEGGGVRSMRPHETDICVHDGAVSSMRHNQHHEILDEIIISAVGMKTWQGLRGVHSGAGLGGVHVSRVQVSRLLPASMLPDVRAGKPWA
jgi:hypothetical protein